MCGAGAYSGPAHPPGWHPAFDPNTHAIYLETPIDSPDSAYQHGLVALQVGADCRLTTLWNVTVGLAASA